LAVPCPSGIDVYFENVGGPIWQAVLPLLNRFAWVPLCGLIAHYNGATGAEQNLLPATMLAVLRRSRLLRGYINTEFVDEHYDSFLREIGPRVLRRYPLSRRHRRRPRERAGGLHRYAVRPELW
jgi:NADPH-dependent curcumin reductase CurA